MSLPFLRKQRDCSLDLVASNSKPRRPKLFEQVLQFRVLDCDVDAQELGLIVGKTRVPKRLLVRAMPGANQVPEPISWQYKHPKKRAFQPF
jgi:hypothetical protein